MTISRGFWLGKYEVTQGEWEKIMGTTIREQRRLANAGEPDTEGANYPIYEVSHQEATRFCRKLTDQERRAGRLPKGWEYRLPTEAQWEYACRAGTKTATAFGDNLNSDQANFDGNYPYDGVGNAAKGEYLERTTTVGSYKANAWRFYDMHGNVMEWCEDPAPTGVSGRAVRGGSFLDSGRRCRSAYRYRFSDYGRRPDLGFRVALVQSAGASP